MNLGLNDLHCLLNAGSRSLKLYDAAGHFVFGCEARNRTTADGQYGHNGNCPPGEFLLGAPSPRGTVPFGDWFIPILDYGSHLAMALHHRQGIGIHGGGSGLVNPFAPRQGWQVTHGCWRIQNEDLGRLKTLVKQCQADGGHVYVTVIAALPGDAEAVSDWAPAAELAEGE